MFESYLKVALRNLNRHRNYAFINIVGLSVGMACCLLILLFVRDELSYDRYHHKRDDIYRLVLEGHTDSGTIQTSQTAPAWAPLLVKDYPEVREVVRFKPPNQMWLVSYGDRRFLEKGFVFADSTVFDVFTFPLLEGDPKTALVAPFTVVLTEAMARKYFGNDDAVGRILRLDNQYDFAITGILQDIPENSHFHFGFLASMSSLQNPIYGENFLNQPIGPALYTYVLLEEGYPASEFEGKLPTFIDRYIGAQLRSIGVEMKPYTQRLTDIHLHSNLQNEIEPNGDIDAVYVFSAVAVLILLIACINFMNLATARSASRAKEVGIRKVFGAFRRQLIQQFVGESILLSALAVVIALFLVVLLLPFFNVLTGKSLSIGDAADPSSIFGLIVFVLFVGIVAGSYPAFLLSRFRPILVLKDRLHTAGSAAGLRKMLVVVQFAVSVFLLVGTATVYHQLTFVRHKDLGFDEEHVVVVQLTDPSIRAKYEALRTRVSSIPSVESTSASSSAPGHLIANELALPEGATNEQSSLVESFSVDYDFIRTLGLQLSAGRAFAREFGTDPEEAFILNERAVEEFGWDSPRQAVGKRIQSVNNKRGRVIGVVKDFHSKSLRQRIGPALITLRNEQTYFYMFARIRPGDIAQSIASLEAAWRDLFPAYVFQYTFLDEDFAQLYSADRRLGQILGTFTLLAISVACLGLFGLASFTTQQRTKEIGVRKVLGASEISVVLLLSREFSKLVLFSFLVAMPLAYFVMSRWLEDFAYRAHLGVGIFFFAGGMTLCIAWLTVSYQSIMAALSNPADALRYE